MKLTHLPLVLCGLLPGFCDAEPMIVHINASAEGYAFKPFWNSTGFTPGEWLHSEPMQATLSLTASQPRRGPFYVRPHYLLNLVEATIGEDGESLHYDFSRLDRALDELVAREMPLIFEVMGNPSGRFNLASPADALAWKGFVEILVTHLIERYGEQVVHTWIFETWNEPDLDEFWPHGRNAFLRYYDATSEGLRAVDSQLRFGGPGNAGGFNGFFRNFIEHCAGGENFITGETGSRLDFVSIHRKFVGPEMVAKTQEATAWLAEEHPDFARLPFLNTEADPTWGWARHWWWRTHPWYAAFVVEAVDLHDTTFRRNNGVNLALLSNDNGFLGSWGQRTQTALLGPDTQDGFALVPKPVFHAMGLLGFLGDTRLPAQTEGTLPVGVGLLATRTQDGALVLASYHRPELDRVHGAPSRYEESGVLDEIPAHMLRLELSGLLADLDWKHLRYRLDEKHGYALRLWEELGRPAEPHAEDLRTLLKAARVPSAEIRAWTARSETVEVDLPPGSLVLDCLVPKPAEGPATVQGVQAESHTGLGGTTTLLLRWQSLEPVPLLAYVIEEAGSAGEAFREVDRVSPVQAYWQQPEAAAGFYRVRAVDAWERSGPASEPVSFQP